MENITLQELLNKLKEYNPDEVEIVKKAYKYADNFSFGPREDWMDKAQTSLAKKKIKNLVKK